MPSGTCSCSDLLEEVQLIDLKGTPVRAQAREAGLYWEAVVAADIAGAIKALLQKNLAQFQNCSCQSAEYLRVIWVFQVLQQSDQVRRLPIEEEKFFALRKAIWRSEHPPE